MSSVVISLTSVEPHDSSPFIVWNHYSVSQPHTYIQEHISSKRPPMLNSLLCWQLSRRCCNVQHILLLFYCTIVVLQTCSRLSPCLASNVGTTELGQYPSLALRPDGGLVVAYGSQYGMVGSVAFVSLPAPSFSVWVTNLWLWTLFMIF